eukprot:tig00020675_g12606.t1
MKLEKRRQEREEQKRAQAELARAREEAERVERAQRDVADRESAEKLMQDSNWARARSLLNALLKLMAIFVQRSPQDAEARLLRIQCMVGAGQLDEATREVAKWESRISAAIAEDSTELLAKVRRQRELVESELEARRTEQQRRAEREREEAERRRVELEEQRCLEEAARCAAQEAERQRLEEEQRWEEERRREEARRAAAAEEQRRLVIEEATSLRRRTEREARDRPPPPCRFFPSGACRNGTRCRFAHVSAANARPPAPETTEPEPECAICLDTAPPPRAAGRPAARVALRCGHRFHRGCMETWRGGCPFRCGESPAPAASAASPAQALRIRSPRPAPAAPLAAPLPLPDPP